MGGKLKGREENDPYSLCKRARWAAGLLDSQLPRAFLSHKSFCCCWGFFGPPRVSRSSCSTSTCVGIASAKAPVAVVFCVDLIVSDSFSAAIIVGALPASRNLLRLVLSFCFLYF